MKTLALEGLYADPHRIDPLLQTGERVQVKRGGQTVAEIVPKMTPLSEEPSTRIQLPLIEGAPGNVIRPTREQLDAACFGEDDEAP